MAHTITINNTNYTVNNIYYCSPDGNDATGDGSIDNPFFSYLAAYNRATDGDAIYFLKGEYNYTNEHVYRESASYTIPVFTCAKNILICSDIRNTKINILHTGDGGRGYNFYHMNGKLINVHFKIIAMKEVVDTSWNGTLSDIFFVEPRYGWICKNCIFEFYNPFSRPKHALIYDNNYVETTIKNCVFHVYGEMRGANYSGRITLSNCVCNKQIVHNEFSSGGYAIEQDCIIDESMDTSKNNLLSYTSKISSGKVYIDNKFIGIDPSEKLKKGVLNVFQTNELFNKYVSVIDFGIEPYYIIPLGDKTKVFETTMDDISQENAGVSVHKDYIYNYYTSIERCCAYYQTKEMIDLSLYNTLKFHFSQTERNKWPGKIFLVDKDGTEILLESFTPSGDYEDEIDVSEYNDKYYILLNPEGNTTYWYYLYLEP